MSNLPETVALYTEKNTGEDVFWRFRTPERTICWYLRATFTIMVPMEPSEKIPSARVIDRICDQFETRWSAKTRPQFDSYLQQVDEGLRDQLLEKLLAVDFELRAKAGQPIGPEDYRRLGDHAVATIERLLTERSTQNAEGTTAENESERNDARPTRSQADYDDESMATVAPTLSPLEFSLPLEQIGRYQVERILGQGGFGVVYLAKLFMGFSQ